MVKNLILIAGWASGRRRKNGQTHTQRTGAAPAAAAGTNKQNKRTISFLIHDNKIIGRRKRVARLRAKFKNVRPYVVLG